jgi:hypothetical protein
VGAPVILDSFAPTNGNDKRTVKGWCWTHGLFAFMYAVVTVIIGESGVVRWDSYNYCVKISYQGTPSEDRRLLCELWLQWYWGVVQWDYYSLLWWRSISGQ